MENGNGTRRLPTYEDAPFLGHFWGLIFVPPVTTARNLKLLER
jgi:hypothetical protein